MGAEAGKGQSTHQALNIDSNISVDWLDGAFQRFILCVWVRICMSSNANYIRFLPNYRVPNELMNRT